MFKCIRSIGLVNVRSVFATKIELLDLPDRSYRYTEYSIYSAKWPSKVLSFAIFASNLP